MLFRSKKSYHGTVFKEANLSNSNFEGVNLSPAQFFIQKIENAGDQIGGAYHPLELMMTLYGRGYVEDVGYIGLNNIHVISTEQPGNDLIVKFVFFNNFYNANLENANFQNADLWHVGFALANLTNANLSGADLSKALLNNANLSNANLQGADLSGADLSGADLSDAIYDQNSILKCVNHDICV